MAHDRPREMLLGGVVAGLCAGVAMAAFTMLIALAQGASVWATPRGIAAVIVGQAAGHGGVPVAVGFALHFLTSVVWGLIFAALIGHASIGQALGWGVVYGFIVYLLMFYVVVPIVSPPMLQMRSLPLTILEHLVYGAALAVYAPLRDALGGHRRLRCA